MPLEFLIKAPAAQASLASCGRASAGLERVPLTALSPYKACIEIGEDEVLAAVVVTNSCALSGFGKKEGIEESAPSLYQGCNNCRLRMRNRTEVDQGSMGHKFYVNFVGSPDATRLLPILLRWLHVFQKNIRVLKRAVCAILRARNEVFADTTFSRACRDLPDCLHPRKPSATMGLRLQTNCGRNSQA